MLRIGENQTIYEPLTGSAGRRSPLRAQRSSCVPCPTAAGRQPLPFMKSKLVLLLSAFGFLFLLGCASTPFAWESKFYDIQTNITPVVVYQTNTVTRTNVIESVVTTTNVAAATGAIEITMTPTREYTVVSEPVVTIKTNLLVDYLYTANPNAGTIARTGGAIGEPFGVGGLVSTAVTGLFGIWAAIRSRRNGKLAAGLAQGIEVASEVLRTTPQGGALDERQPPPSSSLSSFRGL